MSHEPARKEKTGRRRHWARITYQLDVTVIFCGKLLLCPARPDAGHPRRALKSGLILPIPRTIEGGIWRPARALLKTKAPSGGTTGRVKPYGRLGWMGARAEYSLDGEGLPLPHRLVAEGPPHVQTALGFF